MNDPLFKSVCDIAEEASVGITEIRALLDIIQSGESVSGPAYDAIAGVMRLARYIEASLDRVEAIAEQANARGAP